MPVTILGSGDRVVNKTDSNCSLNGTYIIVEDKVNKQLIKTYHMTDSLLENNKAGKMLVNIGK